MQQKICGMHREDPEKRPAGGRTVGLGILIDWQDGPLGRGADRKEPNGAFVEGVIAAAIDRLEYYQSTPFECLENQIAINLLRCSLATLDVRTVNREKREVEGTHEA